MIQFNFQKISQVPERSLKQKKREIQKYLKSLRISLGLQTKFSDCTDLTKIEDKNYNCPESFIKLPYFSKKFSQKISKKFKLIILIGIGGSNMAAQAVYKALESQKNLTEILFLDTFNPYFLKKIFLKIEEGNFKKSEIAVCFISNSGTAFETIINFFVFQNFVKKYSPEIFIVTGENSILEKFGKKKKIKVFTIPKQIPSRYSIFSNIGLLPLYLCGVNIKELLLGAQKANEICLDSDFLNNLALISSLIIFYHWKFKNKNIYTNFVFPQELEFFGKWYCQLMAESLGKNGKGITPTMALATDLHSLIQLYFDGPRDKLTNFIFVKNLEQDFLIPDLEDFNKIFPNIENKKMWGITNAIYQGVKNVYIKKQIPFTEIILPKLDERNLGFLFQMKMIEIVLLAKLMKINPFDQPAVELYKQETKNILKKL